MVSISCDQSQLPKFVAGELLQSDEDRILRHLDSCVECQKAVEVIAGGERWWHEMPLFLSPDHDPLCVSSGGDFVASDRVEDTEPAVLLDFLAPTDDPDSMGRLGSYEVVGIVGRGGTGTVLKAFDRGLNRYVAMKVLEPHLARNPAARQRFAREARAAAAVVHEHIVPIHAVSEHRGIPFIVMQYVGGRSLQQRLDANGPLKLCEVLRVGLQTAAGLAAAHEQGLVHRDVKPANILMENDVERVLLTDFGLARTVDEASLTCSGVIAGTPQYMAPEQARGDSIDYRADLFSLGSVLYAMCTGHSPFRAETTMGVLHRICHATPRPVQELNPEIPLWMSAIISRLHTKNPSGRYSSASEVAETLKRHLARLQSTSGSPALSWTEAWLSTRAYLSQHKRHLGALTILLAVLVIGVLLVSPFKAFEEASGRQFSSVESSLKLEQASPTPQVAVSKVQELPASIELQAEKSWMDQFQQVRSSVETLRLDWQASPPPADSFLSDVAALRQGIVRLRSQIEEVRPPAVPDGL